MNSIFKTSLAAIALATSFAASATYCLPGTAHAGQGAPYWPDNCNDVPVPPPTPTPTPPPVVTPTTQSQTGTVNGGTMTGTVNGHQQQRQHQQQTATGGTSNATSTANAANSGQYAGQNAGRNAGANAGRNAGANAGRNAGANSGQYAGQGAGSNNPVSVTANLSYTGVDPSASAGTKGTDPLSASTNASAADPNGVAAAAAAAAAGAAAGSHNNGYIIHPAMIPPSAVAINPQGNLLAVQTSCGPLVHVVPHTNYATSQGFFGGTEQIPNGENYTMEPFWGADGQPILFHSLPQADGSTILVGSMVIVGMSITNQSMAVNGALGLIKASGAGGQVGGGASMALQQMGDHIVAVPCIFAVPKAEPKTVYLPEVKKPIRE